MTDPAEAKTDEQENPSKAESAGAAEHDAKSAIPWFRLSITGVFMGLANLVPGVSGGTMVLALGLYEEFIGAFSDLTRLRFRFRSIIVVGFLFGISAVTIFALSDVIQFLMEMFLPGMLALFIGMTLGGAPMLWRQMRPLGPSNIAPALVSFIFMGLLAFVFRPDTSSQSWLLFFLGGVAGSSAMILPGISGSYILLILGLYLPIIAGVIDFKDALKAREFAEAFEAGWRVILPVGLGLVAGLALLSNLLKILLDKYHRVTIGFLMGLLLGSVLGLYPFKGPEFGKLARYAVDGELRVIGAGWDGTEESRLYLALTGLENEATRLRIVRAAKEAELTAEDLAEARETGAILIAYDQRVPKEIRRDATRSEPEVELVIVPNTEFSAARAVGAVALIIAGFFITFYLGRMKKDESEI